MTLEEYVRVGFPKFAGKDYRVGMDLLVGALRDDGYRVVKLENGAPPGAPIGWTPNAWAIVEELT